MPALARELEHTLHNARAEARRRRHEYATLEHLLHALIGDSHASAVMKACGVDLDQLGEELTTYLDKELEPLRAGEQVDPNPTAGFQRVVQRAILHVQDRKTPRLTPSN